MKSGLKAILLAGCICGLAGAAETAQQRGKRVIDEAVAALGGDAFLHMKDRVESGRAYSFDNSKLSGLSLAKIYTRYMSRPEPPIAGKLLVTERESFGRDEDMGFVLLTDKEGWDVTFRGARPMDEERFANYRDATLRNIFYILRQRLGEPELTFYSQGSDIYNNRPVNVVDITDADDITVTVYFDQGTKLPIRQTYKRRNKEYHDFDKMVSEFAKYRDVPEGVKWPFDIRRDRNDQKVFEMFSESVEINKDLKDDLFALPANAKVLKK